MAKKKSSLLYGQIKKKHVIQGQESVLLRYLFFLFSLKIHHAHELQSTPFLLGKKVIYLGKIIPYLLQVNPDCLETVRSSILATANWNKPELVVHSRPQT